MIRGIDKAYAISAVGHGVVLLWSVLSFAAKPLPTPPSEALPVDIVSVSEFTQMTAGNKDAPKVEAQKPLVEKVAEAKAVEDPTAKVVEKKEVKAAREAPPPVPETKPAEPEKKVAEVKPDQIAEALAKDEAKPTPPEPKKAEAKPPTPTQEACPTGAQVRSQEGRSAARQARFDAACGRRRHPQQRDLAGCLERSVVADSR